MSIVSRRIKNGTSYARCGCVAHHSRGAAICSNDLSVSERRASRAIVDALKGRLQGPEAIERFVETFEKRVMDASAFLATHRDDQERRIQEVERRIANLTEALAHAGWSQGLSAKLREEEATRAKLKTCLPVAKGRPLAHGRVRRKRACTRSQRSSETIASSG